MTNVNNFEKIENLRLPSCYVDVSREEMEYVDGGFLGKLIGSIAAGLAGLCGIIGGSISVANTNDKTTKITGGLSIAAGILGDIAAIAMWF